MLLSRSDVIDRFHDRVIIMERFTHSHHDDIGQFKVFRLQHPREKQDLGHMHNNFIHIAAENGVIGLAGLLYFIGFYLYTSLRNHRKNKNPYDILVFTICLGYICIFGQIDYTLGVSDGMRMLWFLLAVLLQLKETERLSGEIPSASGISVAEIPDGSGLVHR